MILHVWCDRLEDCVKKMRDCNRRGCTALKQAWRVVEFLTYPIFLTTTKSGVLVEATFPNFGQLCIVSRIFDIILVL